MSLYELPNKFIGNTLTVISCSLLMVFIFKCKIEVNKKTIIYLLIFYSSIILSFFLPSLIASILIEFLLAVIFMCTLFEERIIKKVVFLILALFLEGFSQGIIFVIFRILKIDVKYLEMFITFFLIILFVYVVNRLWDDFLTKCMYNKISYIFLNMLIGLCTGFVPLIIISMYGSKLNREVNVSILVATIIMTLGSILSTFFYLKKYKENNEYQEELRLQENLYKAESKYYMNMVDEYNDLRSFRHDINGHIHVLYSLAQQDNSQKVMDYIRNLEQEMKSNIVHQCDNIYIAATLAQYLHLTKEQAITFEFTYANVNEIIMKNTDICSLFNNLMSNAVEASMKCEKERKIKLNIEKVDFALLIELQNTVHMDFTLKELECGKTSKRNKVNHGIGLVNIDKVINKYHGDIKYDVKGNTLSSVIVLTNVFK